MKLYKKTAGATPRLSEQDRHAIATQLFYLDQQGQVIMDAMQNLDLATRQFAGTVEYLASYENVDQDILQEYRKVLYQNGMQANDMNSRLLMDLVRLRKELGDTISER